ncbi:hypothetical protein [Synechococcus phage S-H38]|uniref:DUF7201 domain-containing protein n=1 Tax=Synechococcus phage S-H38 TaxID=2783673 RepID=A0A873WFZ7_9CAUD|nr:hypothetical protein PQC14_gp005 [Synechococcus phage S-H38]QPB07842.1 hypothetical protein [Synechococcus phage S-H38]
MAFGLSKLAVLESKLDIYEDLSKEMLDKLERAVGTISENSNKVAVILERHENRLDEGDKANAAIIKMINDHQKYDERMFERFNEKFDSIEKRISELYKFRWMTAGVAAAAVLIIGSANFFGNLLTAGASTPTMEFRSNTVQN